MDMEDEVIINDNEVADMSDEEDGGDESGPSFPRLAPDVGVSIPILFRYSYLLQAS